MKPTHAYLTAALISGALAAPGSTLAQRMRHRSLDHLTLPLQDQGSSTDSEARVAGASVQYSNNWSGVVREQAPPEGPYTAVTATFTIPTSTAVANQNGVQAGSVWVGIDGDTYPGAILQAGVDFYSDPNQQNHAWFEWYPAYATNFPNIDVNEGDTIVSTVRSTSPSEGIAIIENKSTGQKVSQTVTAPAPTATLVGQNAEWIVEDFQSGDSMVVMANFGEVKFSGAQAEAGKAVYGLDGGAIVELKQNDKVLTQTEVTGNNDMTVRFIGA
ncbi:peptidase A4 family-domain-containing protein [Aspergillus pseudonomiae]|uniref:Peptidase A4 family-domain-containing protein n=1 Tax=Aspergillus pseudonomiae TaxID=1506151 RepID=A0A5N7D493_9EURO|nr:peptidase A4 family-domain-containing protein [Aspergillus pseudonomiae]KAB8262504.1 peptidase A4 family-domain-containing protein [Aspergillus pseudonomiae]KAE8401232.1 peptidase A4 family-domain-containing protein [Aspergillus pseudonomiae]